MCIHLCDNIYSVSEWTHAISAQLSKYAYAEARAPTLVISRLGRVVTRQHAGEKGENDGKR